MPRKTTRTSTHPLIAAPRAQKTSRKRSPTKLADVRAKRAFRIEQERQALPGPHQSAEPLALWCTALKQLMASSLDTTAQLATETLKRCEDATAWTKDTPWAPLFITPLISAHKLVDESMRLMRMWWQIEQPNGSPVKQ